jgi:hypothetical protein
VWLKFIWLDGGTTCADMIIIFINPLLYDGLTTSTFDEYFYVTSYFLFTLAYVCVVIDMCQILHIWTP